MRNSRWACWLFWVGLLPMLVAYPVPSPLVADSPYTRASSQWEHYWIRYAIALSSVTATALTLAGCLCCQRHRRPKGFQDKAEKCKQEFKDGSSIGQDSSFDRSVEGLELDASRALAASERVQFEPLPVDSIVSGTRNTVKPKSIPLSAPRNEEQDIDRSILQEPCGEWFKSNELNVPREKLKYLREIGHGWFGKVVEGRADLEHSKGVSKSGGVVVRILTEEATTKEKAWFLGEATPYLKLRHQNVLALLGFCLETDPYLLLFESCPAGDLKGFLLSNRDRKSREALGKENVPTRIAIEVAAGLKHMHNHGFAHTDLSARNCLVAPDLSAKLGDYGTGIEKYPEDYYIAGDRALPIRWSAPESLNCTETAIETQDITLHANMWSYAVLLWEIVSWGQRPYNDMNDEQVIQMILSLKNEFSPNGTRLLQSYLTAECPPNIFQAIHACLNVKVKDRPSLDDVRQILLNEHMSHADFEQRWESLRANAHGKQHVRSASLQDLRGSIDSDYWTHIVDDAPTDTLRSLFRLGPDEQVRNIPTMKTAAVFQESGSETEEESWKGRIEQGVYTEKVKQKSKSVTDLMVLVHIDPDSDAEWSMGTQVPEKNVKKKLAATGRLGSESDLRRTFPTDEFDEALKRLRDPLPGNGTANNKIRSLDNLERPKLLTLTMDQGQTPILRLALDNAVETPESDKGTPSATTPSANMDSARNEKHVLRLLSKGDPDLPLLRYVPDSTTSVQRSERREERDVPFLKEDSGHADSPEHFLSNDIESGGRNALDVLLWNHALDSALEQKIPGFSDVEVEFNEYIDASVRQDNVGAPELAVTAVSTPDASRFCNAYSSIYTADDNLSTVGDAETERKPNDDEEERKQLSTPDDEQSSDSGFRDKESCEEEEAVCLTSGNLLPSLNNTAATSESSYPEEEPFQILFELDNILDAEYYAGASTGPESITEGIVSIPNVEKNTLTLKQMDRISDLNHISSNAHELENQEIDVSNFDFATDTTGSPSQIETEYENAIGNVDIETKKNETQEFEIEDIFHRSRDPEATAALRLDVNATNTQRDSEQCSQGDYENEDEDSSTVSLRSDNSYVSFGMEEEFVTAIRNELREKLPQAQMQIVESLEDRDDGSPSISNDTYGKRWDDEDNEDSSNQIGGGVDISIRYNVYGTPLSPILEERESTVTSESLMSNSREVSIASRESVPSEDVLLVDTRTNEMILLEGLGERLQDDDRDTTNGDLSEEENLDYTCSMTRPLEDKSRIMKIGGGAPLPSPEEESKWQQLPSSFPLPLPLPLPLEDDLMSTSFAEREYCSQDEDEEEEEEEEEAEDDEAEEEDEDNSSSSGEFVWKRYNEPHIEQIRIRSTASNNEASTATNVELEEELGVEDVEEEEEEFTPSAWNAALAPHRSALRSPDKTLKSGDQKKSVWFKKQRYHCVYEYPKETLPTDSQVDTTTNPQATSYSDWEEMMDEPRLDVYPLDYDDANHTGNEEFFVTSSNRPFQFQTGESRYVSQFFPGATTLSDDRDETDGCQQEPPLQNNIDLANEYEQCQQHQLGELRHTRDRLKLNLVSSNGAPSASFVPVKQSQQGENDKEIENQENHGSPTELIENDAQDQHIVVTNPMNPMNPMNDNTLPKVPHGDAQLGSSSTRISQCDSQETLEPTECSVSPRD